MPGKPQAVCRHRTIQAILLARLVLASSLRATAAAPLFAALAVPLCAIRAVPLCAVSIARIPMPWSASAARPASHGSNRRLCPLLPLSGASSVVPAAWCGSAAIRPNWSNQPEPAGLAGQRAQYVPVRRWQLQPLLPGRCRTNDRPVLPEIPVDVPAQSAPYILCEPRKNCFRCAKAFAPAAGIRDSLVLRALDAMRSAAQTEAWRTVRKRLAAVRRWFLRCLEIPVQVCAAWQRQAVPV